MSYLAPTLTHCTNQPARSNPHAIFASAECPPRFRCRKSNSRSPVSSCKTISERREALHETLHVLAKIDGCGRKRRIGRYVLAAERQPPPNETPNVITKRIKPFRIGASGDQCHRLSHVSRLKLRLQFLCPALNPPAIRGIHIDLALPLLGKTVIRSREVLLGGDVRIAVFVGTWVQVNFAEYGKDCFNHVGRGFPVR